MIILQAMNDDHNIFQTFMELNNHPPLCELNAEDLNEVVTKFTKTTAGHVDSYPRLTPEDNAAWFEAIIQFGEMLHLEIQRRVKQRIEIITHSRQNTK